MKKKINFTFVIWKEGKYYVAQCLNIDISSFGNTRIGALNNLKEAVGLYLEDISIKIPRITSTSVIRESIYA